MSARPRLDSWKEIAAHLGRDIRTVIRWEAHRGLPVYRLPGGPRPRVFAYPDELDRWLENGMAAEPGTSSPPAANPPAISPSRPWRLAGAAALFLLAATALWAWARTDAPVVALSVAHNELLALDAAGRTRWVYKIDKADIVPQTTRWPWLGDLDGDGRDDALAALQIKRPPSNQFVTELSRFSADGTRRWTTIAHDSLTFREARYGPPWTAADLRVYQVAGQPRIAWSVHHFTWWPGLLVTLNADGSRVGTFVNSGWIRHVEPSADGQHLLVAGISHNRQAYFFAVLDAANPSGRSPELPGSVGECLDCPDGDPLQYFVFPRPDVSRQQPFPADGPAIIITADGSVQVQTLESHDGPNIATTIYEFRREAGPGGPYAPKDARFSDSFWEWHRLFEQEGKLDHAAASCPERRGLLIEEWTAATGWESLRVPVR